METKEDKIMPMRNGDYLQRDKRFPRMTSDGATARLDEILTELNHWRVIPEKGQKTAKNR